MTDMRAWTTVKTSILTANMFILFFLWGWWADKRTKNMKNKAKRFIIIYGGSALIILALRIGGVKTIFG